MAENQENNLENATCSNATELNGETAEIDKRIALITGITGQVEKISRKCANFSILSTTKY